MDEPIAIIGLDARFPGDADTADNFFQLLLEGRSARSEIPADRYSVEGFSGSTRVRTGHFLKNSVTAFDAPFFSITPAEAKNMDPQQRGMLECVYHALENAGVPIDKIAGSQTGVYMGCFSWDYNEMISQDLDVPLRHYGGGTIASMLSNRVSWFFDLQGPSMTIDTACSSSLVAVHEACMSLRAAETSMALVGGCNLILSPGLTLKLDAAGVLSPSGISHSFDHRANGYSRGEGFGTIVLKRVSDAIRDGDIIRSVIRSSGVGQDGQTPGITKPSHEAQARLIREVYARAGLDPGMTRFVEAHGTGTYVGDPIEASALGDVFGRFRSEEEPLYVGALKSNVGHLEGAAGIASVIKGVYVLERGVITPNAWFERAHPEIREDWHLRFPTSAVPWPHEGLRRLSVNSFGVGGTNAHLVMDDALHYLQECWNGKGLHRTLPLGDPAEHSRLKGKHESGHRVKGEVSHDIYSSNNNSNSRSSKEEPAVHSRMFVFSSSHDQQGISRLFQSYRDHITHTRGRINSATEETDFLADLSSTLASRRSLHRWRAFCVADSLDGLEKALGQSPSVLKAVSDRRLAFVFTGQGAQWASMGKELMVYPVFEKSLGAADRYLASLGCTWPVVEELRNDTQSSNLDDPGYSQPLCTILQVALVDLLATWNLHPSAVVGHSSGEMAAAYAAGAISRESAWRISFYRGKLSKDLVLNAPSPSAMAAVGLDLAKTNSYIDRVNDQFHDGVLQIACLNSSRSQTVSGSVTKINALVDLLREEKIFVRKLRVGIGYHSEYMQPIAEEYGAFLGALDHENGTKRTDCSFYSSLHGRLLSGSFAELQTANYWVQNLVSPVRFYNAMVDLFHLSSNNLKGITRPPTHLLEIGPHSALRGPLRDILSDLNMSDTVHYLSILQHDQPATATALQAVGTLFCHGYSVYLPQPDNGKVKSSRAMLPSLPRYPFNHDISYWSEPHRSLSWRSRSTGRHTLLGAPVPDQMPYHAVWRNHIRRTDAGLSWVADHTVAGDVLFPATGMLVMVVEAANLEVKKGMSKKDKLKGFTFKNVAFRQALRVPDGSEGIETIFCLRSEQEWSEFRLFTVDSARDEQMEHCRGWVRVECETEHAPVDGGREEEMSAKQTRLEFEEAKDMCGDVLEAKKVYRWFKECGLEYGPAFQGLSEVRLGKLKERGLGALARLETEGNVGDDCQFIHPTTFDVILQAAIASWIFGATDVRPGKHGPLVPIAINELWVSASPQASPDTFYVLAHSHLHGRREVCCSFQAVDPNTQHLQVSGSGLVCKALPRPVSVRDASVENVQAAYNIEWKLDPAFLCLDSGTLSPDSSVESQDKLEHEQESFKSDLDALCLLYMREVVGGEKQANKPSAMSDGPGYLQKYISWIHYLLDTDRRNLALDTTTTCLSTLETKVSTRNTPEGRLILAVGQALESILSGTRDPLEVIFHDKLAETVYTSGILIQPCYTQLRAYIDLLAHKNPSLQILEIGAGTGGTTKHVLDAMGSRSHLASYVFTDLSPSFLEAAREDLVARYGLEDSMTFRTLNISHPPSEQEFAPATYDIVVAANVLHATRSIATSLRHAHNLLKPGGRLVLVEITDPACLPVGFVFGLLPGWWLAERPLGPLLSIEEWRTQLAEAGFRVDAVWGETCSVIVASVEPAVDSSSKLSGAVQTGRHWHGCTILRDNTDATQNVAAEKIADALGHLELGCSTASLDDVGDQALEDGTCIVLAGLDIPVLSDMHEDLFNVLKRVVKSGRTIVWITRGGSAEAADPHMELVQGLARSVRSENVDVFFITITFAEKENLDDMAEKLRQILQSVQNGSADGENTFWVRNGQIHVPRLVEASYLTEHIRDQTTTPEDDLMTPQHKEMTPDLHWRLRIGTPGLLDTLRFEEESVSNDSLGDHEVEFRAVAWGINFHDLAEALGKITETTFGMEAAGVVTRVGCRSRFHEGDHVFGLCFDSHGAHRSHIRTHENFLATKPGWLTWSKAATIPIVYVTAYAILFRLDDDNSSCVGTPTLSKRDTILIHSAAGGLGQATIHLAQLLGVTVLATCGTASKRAFLESTYGISSEHIFSSRNLTFRTGVLRTTNNRGADLVVNSLAGEALRASWECVAPFGRFVEVGLVDIAADKGLPMGSFGRGARFEALDFVFSARVDPQRCHALFQAMVRLVVHGEGRDGRKRIPVKTFPVGDAQAAFRHMQSGKHIGKIALVSGEVIDWKNCPRLPVIPRRTSPKSQFSPDASYLIVGGLGGLGRTIARWLVRRGAKFLILISRSGPIHQQGRALVTELEAKGVRVFAPACDATDLEALTKTVDMCRGSLPPIRGCIQGSMVLRDNRFEHMSLSDWNTTLRSKVHASWNLYLALCRKPEARPVDFFILLSSTMGLIGSLEQANYAAGSTFQDALARHLRVTHPALHSVSLNVPVVLGAGFVADKPGLQDNMQAAGMAYMDMDSLLAALDHHCRPVASEADTDPSRAQVLPRFWLPQYSADDNIQLPKWREDPLFRHLLVHGSRTTPSNPTMTGAQPPTAALLAAASSTKEAEKIVLTALLAKIARVLSVDVTSTDPERPLHAHGADSLVVVELRSWCAREIGADVSVFEMASAGGLGELAGLMAGRSRFVKLEGVGTGSDGNFLC